VHEKHLVMSKLILKLSLDWLPSWCHLLAHKDFFHMAQNNYLKQNTVTRHDNHPREILIILPFARQDIIIYIKCQSVFFLVSHWLRLHHVGVTKFYCFPQSLSNGQQYVNSLGKYENWMWLCINRPFDFRQDRVCYFLQINELIISRVVFLLFCFEF